MKTSESGAGPNPATQSTDRRPFRNLEKHLDLDRFDVVDIVPIPLQGDRMVRLRTLEEAIEDFCRENDPSLPGVMGYFVQVRPRKQAPPNPVAATSEPDAPIVPASEAEMAIAMFDAAGAGEELTTVKPSNDGIYLNDGKLNLPYLQRSAEILFQAGDYPLARNIYKAMVQSGEKTGLAIYGIARCYQAEGKLEEARINYEEAIAYYPQPDAFIHLATVLIQQKKDQQAAEVLDRAMLLKEVSTETRFDFLKTAGNCWTRIGNFREAERHYRKALELVPNSPKSDEIYTNLGAMFLQEGKLPEAEAHFQKALAINPKCHQAMTGLGSFALADGNKFAAHAWFARSLEVEIKNPTAIFHLVKCAYELKSYGIAAKILEEYIQVAPVNAHLLYSLAGLQYHLDRKNEARATCLRILQIAPQHAGAQELLNRVDHEQGRAPQVSPVKRAGPGVE